MKILKYTILNNTNLANWLIIASLLVLILQSCTTPKSVGYNMKLKNSQKNKSLEVEEKKDIVTTKMEKQTKTENIYENGRLPTLREQMKIIADKQTEIEVDVDIIKSEISLIKAELVDLKSNLMTSGKINQQPIITGETKPKTKKVTQKQIEEETFLLPDEAVQSSSTKKHNTDKPIIIKPPVKSENKQSLNKTIESNNFEKTSEPVPSKNAENIIDKPFNNNSSTKESEAYEKVKMAETLINNGKVDEAKKIYQEILKQNPKNELTPIAKKMLQQL